MKTVFLLQNQHKQLLNKQGEWVDGREANSLYRSVHHDEALNQMIEVNARDYLLRLKILECEINDRGLPLLKDEDLPPLTHPGVLSDEPAQDQPQQASLSMEHEQQSQATHDVTAIAEATAVGSEEESAQKASLF